jgi:hypothetical protein
MPMPAPSRTVQKPLRVVSGKVAFITGGSSGIGLGIGPVSYTHLTLPTM